MAVAALPSLLTEVETAVGASRPDAVDAAVKAFRAKAPPLELARAAARGVAAHYDPASGVAPRSLAILGAASNLTSVMEPRFQVLPVLQAIAYAASERKPAVPAKPPLVVSGEVTHLGRSFLFAVRAGDVAEAESIFLGMVDEDWERKMAGDMLFRAALEDMHHWTTASVSTRQAASIRRFDQTVETATRPSLVRESASSTSQ